MLESFHIKNFKLFRELKFGSLKRVNLISGKNNVWKSTLLEAVHLYLLKRSLPYMICWQTGIRKEWIDEDFDHKNVLNYLLSYFYNRKILETNNQKKAIYLGINDQTGISLSLKNIDSEYDEGQHALVIEGVYKKNREILLSEFKDFLSLSPEPHLMVATSYHY